MIDTLAIAKRLQKAGDTAEHAEAVAEVFGMVLQENVVTKTDLRDACEKLDKQIDTVAARLDGKIVGLDGRILGLEQRGEALAARYESRLSRAVLTLFVGLTGVISLATSLLMTHVK
ncbi:MAG: hypothetical protein HKL91_10380 [Candidatus Eremiobacteraeota bacterium]|uniref:Putative Phage-related protein n=1 Tax=mine drainage metagenome TaxID=410659 RepID=E6PFU7_9ZZZZ|nr:hypothetical protein [Candidatus Eremiobacteraeota bacterium]